MTAIKRMSGTTLFLFLLFLILPGSFLLSSTATAFSDESLKDLSRLPHFQRIWLQRLDQQNNRRNNNNNNFSSSIKATTTTTSTSSPFRPASSGSSSSAMTTSTATWTDASTTDESLEEVVEGDERVTTIGPSLVSSSIRNADALMETTAIVSSGSSSKVTLTISEAKERLKARRIKSRKVKTTTQQEEEEHQGQQHSHLFQYNKKADNIFRDEKEEAVEVKKHIQRMANAGCSTPALRLVYVRQQHEASPNVRYLPACTWLHRCSDEIGCCTDDSKTCSASHIESVSLPFFVLTMSGTETKRTVTRLSFENHTACECVGRNSDLMPRTEPYISDHHPSGASSLLYNHDESNNNSDEGKSSRERHHENNKKSKTTATNKKGQQQHRRHDDPSSSFLQLGRVATAYSSDPSTLLFQQQQQPRNEEEEEESTSAAKRRFGGASLGSSSSHSNPKNLNYSNNNVSKCRCPSGFTPIVGNNRKRQAACGLCQCHDYESGRSRQHHPHHRERSSSSHHDGSNARHHHHPLHRCGRLKRGLETFSPRDRGCIDEKKCATPECDYGRYVTSAGRCPRRNELRPRS